MSLFVDVPGLPTPVVAYALTNLGLGYSGPLIRLVRVMYPPPQGSVTWYNERTLAVPSRSGVPSTHVADTARARADVFADAEGLLSDTSAVTVTQGTGAGAQTYAGAATWGGFRAGEGPTSMFLSTDIWYDQSGNARHCLAPTTSTGYAGQPGYDDSGDGADIFANQMTNWTVIDSPVMQFGTNSLINGFPHLSRGRLSTATFTSIAGTAWTVAVHRAGKAATFGSFAALGTFSVSQTTSFGASLAGASGTSISLSPASQPNKMSTVLHVGGSGSSARANARYSGTSGTTITSSGGTSVILGGATNATQLLPPCQMVVIWNSELTATQRQAVEEWMTLRFGSEVRVPRIVGTGANDAYRAVFGSRVIGYRAPVAPAANFDLSAAPYSVIERFVRSPAFKGARLGRMAWEFSLPNLLNLVEPEAIYPSLPPDLSVTVSDPAVVAAYTTLETATKLYDYASYWETTQTGIAFSRRVTAAGTALSLGSTNLVIDAGAASVWAYDSGSNTLTVKASSIAAAGSFTTLTTTGTITFAGGSTAGTLRLFGSNYTSPAQITLTGVQIGSEVRGYVGTDPATAIEISGGVESATSTTVTLSHSVAGQSGYIVIAALAYQNLVLPITFSSTDQTIPVSQLRDRQYANP